MPQKLITVPQEGHVISSFIFESVFAESCVAQSISEFESGIVNTGKTLALGMYLSAIWACQFNKTLHLGQGSDPVSKLINVLLYCFCPEVIHHQNLVLHFTHTLSTLFVKNPVRGDHLRGTIWNSVQPHLGQRGRAFSSWCLR